MPYEPRQTSPENAARQHLRAFLRATILMLALGGCQKYTDAVRDSVQPWVGRTISDYVDATGKRPGQVFDNERGERIYQFYPPGSNIACQTIRTVPEGATFRIVGIRATCF